MNIARTELYKQLPLETPFSLHIFPSFYCNFHCNYCLHSMSNEELQKKRFTRQSMDFDIYRKVIDDAQKFNGKIKALIFAGHGEPLMHRDIAEMVSYAKKSDKFERIEIVTNGSLLTSELSDHLIEAGLDRIRISLQGVNEDEYTNVSGVKLDYNKFIEQIRYFYEHKVDTEVYIKIIDVAMKNESEQEVFHKVFDPISDITAIEYAIPFVKEIDYSNIGDLSEKCKQGHKRTSHICSMPFYMLILNPNGDVVPCCSTEVPLVLGNIRKQSLTEIWNSEIRGLFLQRQLSGVEQIPICQECSVPAFGLQEGDYLDGHEEEVLQKLRRGRGI